MEKYFITQDIILDVIFLLPESEVQEYDKLSLLLLEEKDLKKFGDYIKEINEKFKKYIYDPNQPVYKEVINLIV